MPSPLALRSVASTARAARAGRTFAAGVLVRGALWPLAGFTVRHLAPQSVLPSSRGRVRFLVGAAVVGATSTASA
jgi:hypothetical protein